MDPLIHSNWTLARQGHRQLLLGAPQGELRELPPSLVMFSMPSLTVLSLFGGLPLGLVSSAGAGLLVLDLGLCGLGLKLLEDAVDCCIYGNSLTSSPKCVETIPMFFLF